MKTGIHPEYFEDIVFTCACGHQIRTGSVKKEIQIEVCSACHPFYTGKQKFLDTTGRVEKFKRKYGLS